MQKHSKHTEDAILWNQIIEGDEKAFHQLFVQQYKTLMLFGLRIRLDRELVRDMIQDLFLELWKKRSTHPPVNNLDAYLKQVLKRKIYRAVEKQSKVISKDYDSTDAKEFSYETFLIEQETNNQQKSKLNKAFETLTKKQKEIIQLKFYKGLSYEEIAKETGTQKRTIYNQVHSAILILKKYMLFSLIFLF